MSWNPGAVVGHDDAGGAPDGSRYDEHLAKGGHFVKGVLYQLGHVGGRRPVGVEFAQSGGAHGEAFVGGSHRFYSSGISAALLSD